MKISVVIPCFNEEERLPILFESIGKQNFPKKEFEVILVDNNSTDKSAEIGRKFGARVVAEARQGIPYARDTGARSAHGDIIVCTDADCVFPENHLKTIYKKFAKDKTLYALCGSVCMNNAPLIVKGFIFTVSSYAHFYSRLFSHTYTCWALNFSYKRTAFQAVGGYNLKLPLLEQGMNANGSDEYELVEELVKKKGKALFDKDLIIYTSARRFKGRFLYWLIVEHFFGFILNKILYRLFHKVIPIPSYYMRRKPGVFEKLALSISFACVLLFFIFFAFLFSVNSRPIDKKVFQNSISSYQTYKKAIAELAREENPIEIEQSIIEKIVDPVRNSLYLRSLLNPDSSDSDTLTTGFATV